MRRMMSRPRHGPELNRGYGVQACQGQQCPINPGETLMTDLSRRHVMAGAAVATAATALTPLANSPASAAAPLATTQAPGWYRYNLGSYQITVATDGQRSFKLPDTFVLNAKKDQVNEALLAAHMEKDMMT